MSRFTCCQVKSRAGNFEASLLLLCEHGFVRCWIHDERLAADIRLATMLALKNFYSRSFTWKEGEMNHVRCDRIIM